MTADLTLTPVEIRVLAFLGDERRRFEELETIVLETGDAVFSVKAALSVLRRREYATDGAAGGRPSARVWACTGLGRHALAQLTVHQVREAQLLQGDDGSELALRRMGAHGGQRHA